MLLHHKEIILNNKEIKKLHETTLCHKILPVTYKMSVTTQVKNRHYNTTERT